MEVNYHEFSSGKKYIYIKDENDNRVFIRNICFLSKIGDPYHIVTVREWGSATNIGVWEPPKGQMEWKELESAGIKRGQQITRNLLLKQMKYAIKREIAEEAKIVPNSVHNLSPLELVYKQKWPESGIQNAHFLYQFWQGYITDKTLQEAQIDIQKLVGSPELTSLLPHDYIEKDAVKWWSPKSGWNHIRESFSKKMTLIYYLWLKKYGTKSD
jgi:hypothetical protein